MRITGEDKNTGGGWGTEGAAAGTSEGIRGGGLWAGVRKESVSDASMDKGAV